MIVTRYATNSGAASPLKFHLIWYPKNRRRILPDAVRIWPGEAVGWKGDPGAALLALEVMPADVRVWAPTGLRAPIAQFARQFTGETTCLLLENIPHPRRIPTLWSRSYFAGSRRSMAQTTNRHYTAAQRRS